MHSFSILLLSSIFSWVFGTVIADVDSVHGDSELSSDDFYQRVVPSVPEAFDPVGGLDPRDPEILRRNASQLFEQAQRLREAIIVKFDPNEPLGITRLERLVQLAARAVMRPREVEAQVFAKQWSVWWHKTHERNTYDIRHDVDQFLAYTVARERGEIAATASIEEFESELDKDFISLVLESMS